MSRSAPRRFCLSAFVWLLTTVFCQAVDAQAFEATASMKTPGEPSEADTKSVLQMALRKGLLNTLTASDAMDAGKKRSVNIALEGSDLESLRGLLQGRETVVQEKRRAGYLEVTVGATTNPAALEGWMGKITSDHPLKNLRLMVVIPEYHIQRPIPDPAGETEVTRLFLQEGFRLVDQKQVERIRSNDMVKQALHDDTKELVAIARNWGAEMILVGEAFSHDVSTGDEFDRSMSVCRARIEGRIILCDTGEILTINDAEGKAVDLSSAVAAKAALRDAGATFANKMINGLLVLKNGGKAQQTVTVILAGADFAKKMEFEEVLKTLGDSIAGVKDISFADGRAEMEVQTPQTSADLTKLIYSGCKKAGLNINVEEQTNRRIGLRAK